MKYWLSRHFWKSGLVGRTRRGSASEAGRKRARLCLEELESRFAPSATISGIAFQDFNANGVFDTTAMLPNQSTGTVGLAVDQGLPGVTVQAFDSSNVLQGTAVTDANGAYTINATGTGPYRIEFGSLAGFTYSPVGQSANPAVNASSPVDFVNDGTTTTLNVGYVQAPNNYSQDNPNLATSVYVEGLSTGPNAGHVAIASFPYTAGTQITDSTVNDYKAPGATTLATHGQVGTTWGLAWNTPEQTLYAAAYMKAFSGFGPDGTGAVYQINGGTVSLFADLNALYGANTAGANPHAATTANDGTNAVWTTVGQTALGGMAISSTIFHSATDGPNGSYHLYVMNLADRSLYVLGVDAVTGARTSTYRQALPAPIAAMGVTGVTAGNLLGDLEPFAVTEFDGNIYVGAVNSAESTQSAANLQAYVYVVTDTGTSLSFNPTPVLQFPLTFARGQVDQGPRAGAWNPWSPTQKSVPGGGAQIYPQPMLTGLAFDTAGNLVLGFRDRNGDQSDNGTTTLGITAGDTLRATPNVGLTAWTIENNGTAGGITSGGAGNHEGPGGGRYYYQQWYDHTGSTHHNIADGGVLQLPGRPDVLTTSFDPASGVAAGGDFDSGGLSWFNNSTGQTDKAYQLYQGSGGGSPTFAKANGVGDLVALINFAPIQIGNRVWQDTNGDGIQEPGEPGIPNVTVQLVNSVGTVLATAVTDGLGDYYFSSGPGTNTPSSIYNIAGLTPATNYNVRIAGYAGQAALAGEAPSPVDQSPDHQIISTGTASAGNDTAPAVTGAFGQSDDSFDFGWVPQTNVGVFKTADAVNVNAGGTAGFTVIVQNLGSAQANGVTLSDPLPALGGASSWSIDGSTGNPGLFQITGAAGSQVLSLTVTTLSVAEKISVHVTGLTVPSGSPYSMALNNTATVDATNEPSHNQTASASETVLSPNVAVAKTADSPAITAGGTAGFTVTLDNNGLGQAFGVSLTDPLPAIGGNLWTIDTSTGDFGSFQITGAAGSQDLSLNSVTSLTAGQSLTVHITGTTVASGAPFTATLSNTATVDATNEVNHNQQSTGNENVLSPNVTVTKTADSPSVTAGSTAGFTITLTNTGTGQANGVTLSDPLPALGGANLWSIDTTTGDFASFQITGAAGSQVLSLDGVSTLLTAQSLTVHITGTATSGVATLANTATVNATNEVNHNQQGSATITSVTLSLGDFVWNDSNNDGLVDGTEAGIANVIVTLLQGGTAIASTTTNAAGHYEFDGLTAGTYTIQVTPPAGYVSSTGTNGSATGPFEPGVSGTQNNEDHGTTTGAFIDSTVTLGPAGSAADPDNNGSGAGTANFRQDFGLFQPLSIGDFVWNDANNNGVFDTGETGIGGVTVNLDDSTGALVATTTTNAVGGYLFTDLIPGSYRVVFPATDFAAGGPLAGMVSSTGTVGSATGPFEPAPAGAGNNQDHGTTVGTAVQGPLVTLALGTEPTGETATPPGTLALIDPALDANSNRTEDFGFFTSLSIGDTIWNDANNDGLLDNGETGINGVSVALLNSTGTVIATTMTNATGNYLFSDLIPGTYTVRVTPPPGFVSSTGTNGSATGAFEPGVVGNQNDEDHGTTSGASIVSTVTLTAAGNPDGGGAANLRQDFGLFQTLSVGDFVWNDSNNNGVYDPGEAGIAGVTVNLVTSTGTLLATTTTNAQGGYLFTDLIPGQYRVVFPAADFALGGKLSGFNSSSGKQGSLTGPYEPAPASAGNNQDHGTTVNGTVQGPLVTLAIGTEPTGETATPPGTLGLTDPALDANSNRTVDFGFFGYRADIVLQKTAPAMVQWHALAPYTFIVRNLGPNTATGVVVNDPFPSSLKFYTVQSASQGGYNPVTGVWTVGTLQNGQTAELVVIFEVMATGVINNVATASAVTVDPNLNNNVSSVSTISVGNPASVTKGSFLASTIGTR